MAKTITMNGYIKYIMWGIGIIFAAALIFFTVNTNSQNILENKIKLDKACEQVVGLEKDVFYIRERVDQNYKTQQQILK